MQSAVLFACIRSLVQAGLQHAGEPLRHRQIRCLLSSHCDPAAPWLAYRTLASAPQASMQNPTSEQKQTKAQAQPRRSPRAQAKKDYRDSHKAEYQNARTAEQQPSVLDDLHEIPQLQPAELAMDEYVGLDQHELPATVVEQVKVPISPLGTHSSPRLVNMFMELTPERLGEAFQRPHAECYDMLPKGGCRSIQDEAKATGTNVVLYRFAIHRLITMARAAVDPHFQAWLADDMRQAHLAQCHIAHFWADDATSPSKADKDRAPSPLLPWESSAMQTSTASQAGTVPDGTGESGSPAAAEIHAEGPKAPAAGAIDDSEQHPEAAATSNATHDSLVEPDKATVPEIQTFAPPPGIGRKQVFLRGPICSGKSFALAALVDWARANDWVVLYLPSAKQLTHGGFFHEHPEGGWDTPDSAQLVLHGLATNHQAWLEKLRCADDSESLWDVAQRGLNDVQAGTVATQAALDVKQALYQQSEVPLLVAIDGYEALHMPSEYGQWAHQHKRRVIHASELRLASSMQVLLGAPPARGMVVCADGNSTKHRSSVKIPRSRRSWNEEFQRFDEDEFSLMMRHYMNRGIISQDWTEEQEQLAYHLTGGNTRDVRNFNDFLLGVDDDHTSEAWGPSAASIIEQSAPDLPQHALAA